MVRAIVIAAFLVTLGIAGVRETKNYLEYPCLQRFEFPRLQQELILYHRGARDRVATIFVQGQDPRDTPVRVSRLNYAEAGRISVPPPCGDLRWTRDGTGLYATGRDSRGAPNSTVLWLYDTHTGTLLQGGAVHQATGHTVAQQHLARALQLKGGAGTPVASWYEIGPRSGYLYSWKAAHWERLAATAEAGEPAS